MTGPIVPGMMEVGLVAGDEGGGQNPGEQGGKLYLEEDPLVIAKEDVIRKLKPGGAVAAKKIDPFEIAFQIE